MLALLRRNEFYVLQKKHLQPTIGSTSPNKIVDKLQHVQNAEARLLTGTPKMSVVCHG